MSGKELTTEITEHAENKSSRMILLLIKALSVFSVVKLLAQHYRYALGGEHKP